MRPMHSVSFRVPQGPLATTGWGICKPSCPLVSSRLLEYPALRLQTVCLLEVSVTVRRGKPVPEAELKPHPTARRVKYFTATNRKQSHASSERQYLRALEVSGCVDIRTVERFKNTPPGNANNAGNSIRGLRRNAYVCRGTASLRTPSRNWVKSASSNPGGAKSSTKIVAKPWTTDHMYNATSKRFSSSK